MGAPFVEMRNVSKHYGQIRALENVNFNVNKGEVVGLLGDNGAGKSTLIKVLSGAVRSTGGDIIVRGQRADIRNTNDAIALGIETIYQDSALVPQLSIARNLFLGREPVTGPKFFGKLDHATMNSVARWNYCASSTTRR
jgi:simple sugar transport system ATP-binding protein